MGNQQCPFPGCGHIGDFVSKAHCRSEHGMEREEVFKKYGEPNQNLRFNIKQPLAKSLEKKQVKTMAYNYDEAVKLQEKGKKTKEIAEIFGIPLGTLSSRMNYDRKKREKGATQEVKTDNVSALHVEKIKELSTLLVDVKKENEQLQQQHEELEEDYHIMKDLFEKSKASYRELEKQHSELNEAYHTHVTSHVCQSGPEVDGNAIVLKEENELLRKLLRKYL